MSEFSWRLRVTSAGAEAARVSTRKHQFAVGRPLEFDAQYEGVTALEYALGALGAEIVMGLRVFAKRRRMTLDEVEAVVDAELSHALTYLEVVGEDGHPVVSRVAIKVFVASPHDEAALRQLWDDVLARLPLVQTFRPTVDLALELIVTG